MLDFIANAYYNLRQKVGICAYFNPQKAKNHAMQYHELKNLTAGQCTPEEFAAIEAVYMSREDMTKRQAAALWRRLYSRKHRAAAAAEAAEKHSLEYISTLRPGDSVMLPGSGLLIVKADSSEDYNRHARRILLFFPAAEIFTRRIPVYLGWVSTGDWSISKENPAHITKNGKLIA